MEYIIILCTTNNNDNAKAIAKTLVEKNLIACCNIIPNISSIYNWDNKIQEDTEVLMIMKTKTDLYDRIEKEIKAIHKYDIPEIISIPIENGSLEYLNWINKEIEMGH